VGTFPIEPIGETPQIGTNGLGDAARARMLEVVYRIDAETPLARDGRWQPESVNTGIAVHFGAMRKTERLSRSRNARDAWKDHEWYEGCKEFCETYDQNCFDPDYDSEPLETFEPMVRRVCSAPRYLPAGYI
jgi:hypothetical protein